MTAAPDDARRPGNKAINPADWTKGHARKDRENAAEGEKEERC